MIRTYIILAPRSILGFVIFNGTGKTVPIVLLWPVNSHVSHFVP